jgi:endonuclease-3
LELLIATVLSAQCTDVRVNIVTKELFKKYKTAEDYARATPARLEDDIRSTGFYKNKTKSIINCCKKISYRHGGAVPATLDELVKLDGIGRKTANVILGNAFGIPGITVDTHVKRVSYRLALTENQDPVKIEYDLMELVPEKEWTHFSHLIIFHGRNTCSARKPRCGACVIESHCPKVGVSG